MKDCISYFNTTFDLFRGGGVAVTITNSDFGTNSGFTIGAGNITTDPKFCKTILPFELGISSDSGASHTDSNSDNMGANLRIIEIDAADIIINGINIDGQNQLTNAVFIRDTVNHTGLNIKCCNAFDFQGISIDVYDDDTNLDSIISNNIIKNSGNGLRLAFGGNTISENIISGNTIYGIYSNFNLTVINHNVIYNNQEGLKVVSNSTVVTIKNNIFNQNILFGINSEVAIVVTNCCITDSTNSNVDKTAASNFNNNPLFLNTIIGSEDFNIKTTENGFSYNSACKDASDTIAFPDVGAYDIDRSVISDFWQKYQFIYNPKILEFSIISKGDAAFSAGTGTQWLWAKGRRRAFNLKWSVGQYSDEIDRLKVEFFNSLYQRADKIRVDELVTVRFNPLPSQQIDSGTGATVSATGKTITDTAKTLIEDELKGYHVGIRFDSDTGNGELNVDKTLTVAGAGWTVDEWIGFTFPHNGQYYFILSNTATVLTLSDPDDTIATEAAINWSIEKYFKILENTATILTVEDDDGNLTAGTFDWIVRFIECHILSPNMKYSQPRYFFQKETWKTGHNMYLEEI